MMLMQGVSDSTFGCQCRQHWGAGEGDEGAGRAGRRGVGKGRAARVGQGEIQNLARSRTAPLSEHCPSTITLPLNQTKKNHIIVANYSWWVGDLRPKGHACVCATFLVFFSATMPNVKDLSVDELKCISTYTIVEDCLMLMMALGLSVWKAGVNVDGTRTVDRNSPLHCALLSSYKHHLQCHHVQYARTPCSCTQCSRTRTEEAGMSKIPFALGPDGLMNGPWDIGTFNGQPQVLCSLLSYGVFICFICNVRVCWISVENLTLLPSLFARAIVTCITGLSFCRLF